MKILSAILFVLLLQDPGEQCDHGIRGSSRSVDLARMERRYADFARVASERLERVDWRGALDAPYDSGLPACSRRATRRIPFRAPPESVGKTIVFGPPQEGWVFVTRARRLRDAIGHGLATPEVAEKFGVRCAATTVVIHLNELELIEEP